MKKIAMILIFFTTLLSAEEMLRVDVTEHEPQFKIEHIASVDFYLGSDNDGIMGGLRLTYDHFFAKYIAWRVMFATNGAGSPIAGDPDDEPYDFSGGKRLHGGISLNGFTRYVGISVSFTGGLNLMGVRGGGTDAGEVVYLEFNGEMKGYFRPVKEVAFYLHGEIGGGNVMIDNFEAVSGVQGSFHPRRNRTRKQLGLGIAVLF